jgi:hypothetical protein
MSPGVEQDVSVLNLVGCRLSFFTIAWSSERSSLVNSTIYFFFMVGLLAKKGKGCYLFPSIGKVAAKP